MVGLGMGSPVAQMVKNIPAMQETQVQPLGREDPLECVGWFISQVVTAFRT